MEKDKNQELEKILTELNSSIKKNAAAPHEAAESAPEEKKPAPRRKPAVKQVEVVAEESVEEPSANQPEGAAEAPAPEKQDPPAKKEKKSAPRKSQKRPKKEEDLREKIEEAAEAASGFIEEERRSFAESARIIEDELGDRELAKPAVRHIAVTAAEVVPEEAVPPPRRRRAFDQQKPDGETVQGAAATVPGMPKRKRKHMSRRERTTAVLGVLVTVFVLIGVISTVAAGVSLTRSLINSTAQKEELAKVIFPLVIVDIPEFDTPEALDNSAIIQSSIWAFIIDEQDKSKYPKDDLGAMTVPDADIEPYIRRLYGNDVKIQHQSIDDASVQMLYDSENKRYIIESTPRFLPYTPRVDKISRTGDIYTLTVSYVLPDALWNLEKDHSAATVDKVMEYRLKRNKDAYQMLSVKLLNVTGRSEEGAESLTQNVVSAVAPPEEEDLPEPAVSDENAASSDADADSGAVSGEDSSGGSENASSDGETSSSGETSDGTSSGSPEESE